MVTYPVFRVMPNRSPAVSPSVTATILIAQNSSVTCGNFRHAIVTDSARSTTFRWEASSSGGAAPDVDPRMDHPGGGWQTGGRLARLNNMRQLRMFVSLAAVSLAVGAAVGVPAHADRPAKQHQARFRVRSPLAVQCYRGRPSRAGQPQTGRLSWVNTTTGPRSSGDRATVS